MFLFLSHFDRDFIHQIVFFHLLGLRDRSSRGRDLRALCKLERSFALYILLGFSSKERSERGRAGTFNVSSLLKNGRGPGLSKGKDKGKGKGKGSLVRKTTTTFIYIQRTYDEYSSPLSEEEEEEDSSSEDSSSDSLPE